MLPSIDDLRTLVTDNLDILVVEETKIDDTFSDESIKIPGYKHKPFRRDRTRRGGGIAKWLIFSTYLPPWQGKGYYFETLAKALDVYGAKY